MFSSFMKFILRSYLMIGIYIIITPQTLAQEHEHESELQHEPELHEFKNWRIGFGIGHSYLPSGSHSGTDVNILVIPTIGLDFQYWFNPKFGIALKNELEIISYVIENNHYNELEREYPIISVLVALYKLNNGPSFYLGGGIEYETNQNFFIMKGGIEYELEIGRHWDVTPEVYYFNKDGKVGGFGVTITFGKRF